MGVSESTSLEGGDQLELDLEDVTWDEWFRSLPPFPGAEPDEREEPA